METFPRYWPFVKGIHRSPVNSPHKGQGREALMFSLISAWINSWVNNREAGDLRRHRTHYGVTVMITASRCNILMMCVSMWYTPAGTRRNDNVITSKRRRRRRFDVMKTLSLRHYPLGLYLSLNRIDHSRSNVSLFYQTGHDKWLHVRVSFWNTNTDCNGCWTGGCGVPNETKLSKYGSLIVVIYHQISYHLYIVY